MPGLVRYDNLMSAHMYVHISLRLRVCVFVKCFQLENRLTIMVAPIMYVVE